MHLLQRPPSIYDFDLNVQEEARLWQKLLAVLEQSGRQAALKLATEYPHLRGVKIASLYRKLKTYTRAQRDPVALIDKRRFRDLQDRAESAMPQEFLTFVAGRFLGNQRACSAAHTRLVIEWKRWLQTGERPAGWELCGYDRCPAPGANRRGLPDGWSYDNLMERAKPTKAELKIARVGTVAAKSLLPYVPVGREGARFMEWIEFDDVKLDRRAIVPPHGPVEVVQFGALDVASGVYLIFGQRPVLPREDKTKEMLTRRDFLFLVAALFEKYGFPTDYVCHLILERGTATLSAAEAQALYDITGGQVVCGYTGMNGEFVMAWDEKATGNSSGKANIESFHNTFHNACAHLRGQTGKDRDHAPALEFGRRREAMDLMKLGAVLPPELRGLIPHAYAHHRLRLAVVVEAHPHGLVHPGKVHALLEPLHALVRRLHAVAPLDELLHRILAQREHVRRQVRQFRHRPPERAAALHAPDCDLVEALHLVVLAAVELLHDFQRLQVALLG